MEPCDRQTVIASRDLILLPLGTVGCIADDECGPLNPAVGCRIVWLPSTQYAECVTVLVTGSEFDPRIFIGLELNRKFFVGRHGETSQLVVDVAIEVEGVALRVEGDFPFEIDQDWPKG